jgi:hypothetical protein
MIVIDEIESAAEEARAHLSGRIRVGRRAQRVWIRGPGPPCPTPGDALLIAALRTAALRGEDIRLEGVASPRLLANVPRILDVYRSWDPGVSRIDVKTDAASPAPMPTVGRRAGSFFTAGVDSYYTYLRHQEEIEALVFVHGFDVRLGDARLRERVVAGLEKAASGLGRPLIEVETNLRDFLARQGDRWDLAHGAALAAVGVGLSGFLSRLYIAASFRPSFLPPWGSHPDLDPLFGTERVEFVHDGCERRLRKLERVVQCDVALDSLRVCWENRGGAYNCCRCEKCVRTMTTLAILGVLERCSCFAPLDLKRVRRPPGDETGLDFARQNLEDARRLGADPRLVEALERSLQSGG